MKTIISFVVLLSHKRLVNRQSALFVRKSQSVGRFISESTGICSQCMESNRGHQNEIIDTTIMTVLLVPPSCQSDGPLTRTAPGNVGAGAEDVELLPDAAELLCFPLLHQTLQILVTKKWLPRL
jgi:hypothetical protein